MAERRRVGIILLVIVLMLLLPGCVQKSIYPAEKEVIDRERSVDLNGDGIADQYIYTFEPRTVENLTITREMLIDHQATGNLVIIRLYLLTNTTEVITDIDLKEVVPTALTTQFDSLSFSTKYSEVSRREPPITVAWKFTFSGEIIAKTIEYSTLTTQEISRDWIDKNIQSPYIEVQVINPKAVPALTAITRVGDTLYGTLKASFEFYIATALYAAIILFIVIIAMEAGAIIGAFIAAMVKRERFGEELFRWVGRGRKDALVWFAVGIMLIVAGVAITSLVPEISGSVEKGTLERLTTNAPKALGVIVMVLGFVSIYYVVIDLVKGAILGKRYFLEPLDIARTDLERLVTALSDLNRKINEAGKIGIDTSTESVMLGIENKRAEKIAHELSVDNVEMYASIITKAISDVETSSEELDDKRLIIGEWPKWKSSIDELLVSVDKVTPDMLAVVPEQWRKWALTKYLSEHLGEAITIEDGALTRIKVVAIGKKEIGALLGEFMHTGRIEGVAIVRKDGLLVAAQLPEDVDKNLIAAISAKFIANADMVSLELEKGKTRSLLLRTAKGETLMMSGKSLVLLALVKPGEATGYVMSEMEKVVEKMNEMMG